MNGFSAPELHYLFAMNSIVTLDNLWMGRPRTIAAALLESEGHRAMAVRFEKGCGNRAWAPHPEIVERDDRVHGERVV